MVYPVLFLGIYFLWEGFHKKQIGANLKSLIFIGIGFVLTIALTALPYYLQNSTALWWESIFKAPLAYSTGKFHSPIKTLPFLIVVLGLLITGFMTKIIDWKNRELQILTFIVVGVLLSFMQAGKVNGHYLIQLYPFILIPIGMGISKVPVLTKKWRPVIIVLLLLIPMESYLEYANIVSNKMEKASFFNGEGIDVPNYITSHNLETKNIFFTESIFGFGDGMKVLQPKPLRTPAILPVKSFSLTCKIQGKREWKNCGILWK
jgi:hypothetical protein